MTLTTSRTTSTTTTTKTTRIRTSCIYNTIKKHRFPVLVVCFQILFIYLLVDYDNQKGMIRLRSFRNNSSNRDHHPSDDEDGTNNGTTTNSRAGNVGLVGGGTNGFDYIRNNNNDIIIEDENNNPKNLDEQPLSGVNLRTHIIHQQEVVITQQEAEEEEEEQEDLQEEEEEKRLPIEKNVVDDADRAKNDDEEKTTTTTTTETTVTLAVVPDDNSSDNEEEDGDEEEGEDASPIFAMLPNVQMIGIQKAGTTTTCKYLYDEIGVCRPKRFDGEPIHYTKEVHFFDLKKRYDNGITFYEERFKYCQQRKHNYYDVQLSMDGTPNTFGYPERVKEAYESAGGDQLSKLKIFVILRDPIARDLSWYNHLRSDFLRTDHERLQQWQLQVQDDDGKKPMSFHKFAKHITMKQLKKMDDYDPSFYGTYSRHLRRWFQLFERKQILVLSYDELKLDPQMFQQRVLQFLGVSLGDDNNAKPKPFSKSNTKSDALKIVVPSCDTQSMLAKEYEKYNEELYQLLEEFEGPSMEQRPFPRFSVMNCSDTGEIAGYSG